jgi:hypothetical protein
VHCLPPVLKRQLFPVFTSCRTLDIGAHHVWWPLLQTLFMLESPPGGPRDPGACKCPDAPQYGSPPDGPPCLDTPQYGCRSMKNSMRDHTIYAAPAHRQQLLSGLRLPAAVSQAADRISH